MTLVSSEGLMMPLSGVQYQKLQYAIVLKKKYHPSYAEKREHTIEVYTLRALNKSTSNIQRDIIQWIYRLQQLITNLTIVQYNITCSLTNNGLHRYLVARLSFKRRNKCSFQPQHLQRPPLSASTLRCFQLVMLGYLRMDTTTSPDQKWAQRSMWMSQKRCGPPYKQN